jgi:hypothetical protein
MAEDRTQRWPRKRRKKQASRRALWLGLALGSVGLIGGLVFLVVVGVLLFGGNRAASLIGLNTAVTEENAHKVWTGMTLDQVQEVLGRGEACSLNQISSVVDATYGTRRGLQAFPAWLGDETWYYWRNGHLLVFVGFRKAQSGALRVSHVQFSTLRGEIFECDELIKGHPLEDLDYAASEHDKNVKLVRDPRWKTGTAIRKALVGKWNQTPLVAGEPRAGYDFEAGGSCVRYGAGGQDQVARGTYRFVDDTHIEISLSEPTIIPGSKFVQTTTTFRVLVDENELILMYDYPSGPRPTPVQRRLP